MSQARFPDVLFPVPTDLEKLVKLSLSLQKAIDCYQRVLAGKPIVAPLDVESRRVLGAVCRRAWRLDDIFLESLDVESGRQSSSDSEGWPIPKDPECPRELLPSLDTCLEAIAASVCGIGDNLTLGEPHLHYEAGSNGQVHCNGENPALGVSGVAGQMAWSNVQSGPWQDLSPEDTYDAIFGNDGYGVFGIADGIRWWQIDSTGKLFPDRLFVAYAYRPDEVESFATKHSRKYESKGKTDLEEIAALDSSPEGITGYMQWCASILESKGTGDIVTETCLKKLHRAIDRRRSATHSPANLPANYVWVDVEIASGAVWPSLMTDEEGSNLFYFTDLLQSSYLPWGRNWWNAFSQIRKMTASTGVVPNSAADWKRFLRHWKEWKEGRDPTRLVAFSGYCNEVGLKRFTRPIDADHAQMKRETNEPQRSNEVKALSREAPRNAWIYEQFRAGKTDKEIIKAMQKFIEGFRRGWTIITTGKGLQNALKKHCKDNGLDIPRRKLGRRPKQK